MAKGAENRELQHAEALPTAVEIPWLEYYAEVVGWILGERRAQWMKWGPANRLATGPDSLRYTILQEEAGEVARAILEGDSAALREELIQVAATAVAWLQEIARETGHEGQMEAG